MAKKLAAARTPAPSSSMPAHWPASKVEARVLASLVPYARNARTHSKDQVAKIAASIKEWGWTMPVLVDEQDGIVAGHGRVLAAELLGYETVPVVVARGWSEAQRRAYVIADNQLVLEGGWNRELLSTELFDLQGMDFDLKLTGFDDLELKGFLRQGGLFDDDEDKVPALPAHATSRLGDLWLLDGHRVLCGDATDADTVARLFAGEMPRLMVTDPPYGVNHDPEWRNFAGTSKTKRIGKVRNDDRVDWSAAWRLFQGDVAYVWHGGLHAGDVGASLVVVGLTPRGQIIWKKDRFALSRGNYHWHHEPCWYAVREGKKGAWIGGRKQTTVWEIAGARSEDETPHSTQKPLECMARPMRNHDAPLVYDPFLGSGTSLIAAHLLERRCFGLDLELGYVDVILGRWINHTGRQPTLDGDGRTFEQIRAERGGD